MYSLGLCHAGQQGIIIKPFANCSSAPGIYELQYKSIDRIISEIEQMKKKVGEYILEELIGSGAYGEVYRGTSSKAPGELFAIKMIPKKNMSTKVFNYLEREVEILQMLDHENVVKLRDIRGTDNHYYLIFEYCNGGDLASFKKKKGSVKEETVRYILKQIVAGLNAVYVKKAIHRDIKLSNVLLHYPSEEARTNERPIIKLGDFGFARLMHHVEGAKEPSIEEPEPMSFVGTPLNMAPELFHKKPYSFKADIWSLGTIVYELLCGRNCYTGLNKEDLVRNIDRGIYKIPRALGLTTECIDFINACLQLKPENRIKWKQLREHVYLATDNATVFSLERLKTLNHPDSVLFEEHGEYVFSSNQRYIFYGATEQPKSGEEEKVAAQVEAMTIATPVPPPPTVETKKETEKPEEEEYVKVEKPDVEETKAETEGDKTKDYTVSSISGAKITQEDYFKQQHYIGHS